VRVWLSVGDDREPYKMDKTDRDAVWRMVYTKLLLDRDPDPHREEHD